MGGRPGERNALMEMLSRPGQWRQGAASDCSFKSPLLSARLFRTCCVPVEVVKEAMKMLTLFNFFIDMEMQEAGSVWCRTPGESGKIHPETSHYPLWASFRGLPHMSLKIKA